VLPNFLVLDVKPLLPPVLDGARNLQIKVVGFRADGDNKVTDVLHSGALHVPLNKIQAPALAPGWVDAEEELAKGDETSNVDDRIECEMMQLHALNKE
jgi:uncharacterized sporulation protein YeaH/YhbH (DUF444 family)